MVIRSGARGRFVACSGYPRCRNTKPIEKLEELKKAAAARGETPPPLETKAPGKAATSARARGKGSVKPEELGEPPAGFAWTRTGRPVVEVMPEGELSCPDCGSPMDLRRGRFGPFYSCTGFPKCKFVSNLRGQAKKDAEELMPGPQRPKPIPTDIGCEECGSPMMVREGRSGKFLGCSGYPKCRSTRELPADFQIPEPEAAGAAR
jgi:DNA topoisomerase-1